MDYFSKYLYSRDMVIEIANLKQYDWITCAGIIKTMLWLDVKRFVEKNQDTIDDLVKKRGNGWLTFMPLDITGLLRPNEFSIESFTSMISNIRAQDIKSEVEKVKTSLTSLQIEYEATDLYISNCIISLQIPTNDDEWSMFGYSLFWLAKRSRQINIPFTIEQLSKLMEYGDIKSKADAIRGIYEQNYYEFCTVAIKSLLMRITEEFCVLNLIITDDKVKCDFVPPIFDNEQTSNVQGNCNHYWKTKVLNIFEQMYSEKEYIEINLIGVDLLKDLGIQAIDHQVCIHKTNRPCVWVTEINSWECYVNQIDEIRRIANQVVVGTITYIEFLYKNQHHNNKRWDKLTADVKNMKQLLFNDVLIPKSAVDPYCILRENIRKDTINFNNCISKTLGLSINTYTVIRESFRDVYRQLECFFDQFSEILLARLKYESLENIENPRLTLSNLYNSAKALLSLQNEYNALFYDYRTLEDGFETKELEDLLKLVNMFAYVFENPIKGYPLAYDAKQLYRKSKVYIE